MKKLVLLEQLLISISNFLLAILLARLLGVEEFGLFATIWLLVLFLNSIHQAVIVFPMMSISPMIIRNESYRNGLNILQLIFIILSSCIFLIMFESLSLCLNMSDELFPPAILAMIFYHMQDYLRRLFFVDGNHCLVASSTMLSYLSRFVLIALFVNLNDKLTLEYTLYIIAISYFIGCLVGLSKLKITLNKKFIIYSIKKHLKTGKWLIPSAALQWVSVNFFMLLAAVILSPIAVGAIRIGQNIAQLINVILLAAENHMPRVAAKVYRDGGVEKLKSYLKGVTIYLLAPAVTLIPLTLLYSDFIVYLVYGEEFKDYSFVLVWFSFMTISLVLMTVLRTYLRVLEETKAWLIGYLFSSIFALTCAYPLEMALGISGALVGMALSQIILLISAFLYFKNVGIFNENKQARAKF